MAAHDICLKCFKTSWTQIKLDKICSVGWWSGEGIISLMTQFSCYIGIVCCSSKNNVKRIRHTPTIWNYSINTNWNNRNPSTVMLLVKLPLPGLILVQQRYVAIRKMRLLPTELPNRWHSDIEYVTEPIYELTSKVLARQCWCPTFLICNFTTFSAL